MGEWDPQHGWDSYGDDDDDDDDADADADADADDVVESMGMDDMFAGGDEMLEMMRRQRKMEKDDGKGKKKLAEEMAQMEEEHIASLMDAALAPESVLSSIAREGTTPSETTSAPTTSATAPSSSPTVVRKRKGIKLTS